LGIFFAAIWAAGLAAMRKFGAANWAADGRRCEGWAFPGEPGVGWVKTRRWKACEKAKGQAVAPKPPNLRWVRPDYKSGYTKL